jgi:hypothetical protein
MEATGEQRDVNRHRYSAAEVDAAVKSPVVRRLLKLMEFRSSYPAFDGVFHLMYSSESSVAMRWATANCAASCSSISAPGKRRSDTWTPHIRTLVEHALLAARGRHRASNS